MAGVRIHHPTLKNALLLVPHPGDPRTGRRPKDYPIRLDSDGYAIVSGVVWRRLQECRASNLSDHRFVFVNEVLDPPALLVGDGAQDRGRPIFRQVGETVNEVLDLPGRPPSIRERH